MSDPDQRALQWHEACQWFAKADEDICVAELTLNRDPPLIDPAAFHCQQAAEKIIKGLLVAAAIKVPKTHDLEALAVLALPIYPSLVPLMDDVVPATAWIARTRYPGLTDGVGADLGEVRDMLSSIKTFRGSVNTSTP